jgi:hypothetical protein
LIAFNVVNAIIQQAWVSFVVDHALPFSHSLAPKGMYPTIIIVLVKMQKSLWDTTEISRDVFTTVDGMTFTHRSKNTDTTHTFITTNFSSNGATGTEIASVNISGKSKHEKKQDASEV